MACYFNWSSMSLIKADQLRALSDFMGYVVNMETQAENIGLVLMPQFTYVKGQLWRLETKALEVPAEWMFCLAKLACTGP